MKYADPSGHEAVTIYMLLVVINAIAYGDNITAAFNRGFWEVAIDGFCDWTEDAEKRVQEFAEDMAFAYKYAIKGEELVLHNGNSTVTLKFDRDATMYVDGHVVEDNLVDGKIPLNEYLKRKVSCEAKDDAYSLSGQWQEVNESMSDFSRKYQTQITGKDGQVWYQNGVKYDGMKDGILIRCKREIFAILK